MRRARSFFLALPVPDALLSANSSSSCSVKTGSPRDPTPPAPLEAKPPVLDPPVATELHVSRRKKNYFSYVSEDMKRLWWIISFFLANKMGNTEAIQSYAYKLMIGASFNNVRVFWYLFWISAPQKTEIIPSKNTWKRFRIHWWTQNINELCKKYLMISIKRVFA